MAATHLWSRKQSFLTDWYNARMNDAMLRRIDGVVVIAALATVPIVVLDAQGVRALWLLAANWAVWFVFLADFVADFARKAGTDRKLFSFAIVALSFPALPEILSLSRLARLSPLVSPVKVSASFWIRESSATECCGVTERVRGKRSVFDEVGCAFSGAKPHLQAESGTPRPE